MKKLSKLFLITFLFVIGLVNVDAKPFKIGENKYDTLKDAVDAAEVGVKTTIVMTEDVTGGSGVIVNGKDIVIDFGGHRYETDGPMVGSTGTETQSFQLLKGSTVYMKNGTLIPSTSNDSKMFIQNYCDLTLENITIDGSTNPNAGFYAISSNNGEVKLIGNTSIKVNPSVSSARAFDMCWAPKIGTGTPYAGGTQIIVDTTGKIEGMIELDVWGTYSDENGIKSTLTIKNIDFEGTWSIDSRLANQLSIEGGKFNSSVDEYVKSGYAEYTTDNKVFSVLPNKEIKFKSNEIFVLKGKTTNLELDVDDLYKKYVKYNMVNEEVATFENGVITGKEVGSTNLNATLGKKGDSTSITVFEVKPAEGAIDTDEETNENANNVTTTLIETALSEDKVEGMNEETIENVKEAVIAGKIVETNVVVEENKKEDLEKEVVEKIDKAIEEVKGEVAGYLNIDVILQANENTLGKVTKLPKEIEITVEVDDSIGTVPKDVTRKYFVVRLHEGEEAKLIDAKYEDGKLTFKTDRFSQYAYGYTDTENENPNIPKTGDNIKLYLVLFVMSTVGIAGTVMLSKKSLLSVTK